jgi:hypothetical protein
MSTGGATPPAPQLSHGVNIEYKAFKRTFFTNTTDGVLFLMATCVYPNNGFSIFFQENSGKYDLMEQPPSGIFLNLDTFCVAVWPAQKVSAESPVPSHVTIVDAHGEHRVHVEPWR